MSTSTNIISRSLSGVGISPVIEGEKKQNESYIRKQQQELDQPKTRIKVTFTYDRYLKLLERANKYRISPSCFIRQCALQAEEKTKSTSETASFRDLATTTPCVQVRIYFNRKQYQQLVNRAQKQNIPVQQVIRNATSRV